MKYMLVALVTFLSTAVIAESKSTPPKALPSQMTKLDAAKLDAAVMHREIIMQHALATATPFENEIQRICKLYNIEPTQLGKTVGVDTETGEIQRTPPPPAKTATK